MVSLRDTFIYILFISNLKCFEPIVYIFVLILEGFYLTFYYLNLVRFL